MYPKSYQPPKQIVDQYKFDVKRETLSTVKTKMVLLGEIRKSCGLRIGITTISRGYGKRFLWTASTYSYLECVAGVKSVYDDTLLSLETR